MANTVLQNVQRGIIFVQLTILALIGTFLTIKLIKKRIDLKPDKHSKKNPKEEVPGESAAEKYRESEITEHQVEQAAVKDTILTDDDTCV